jgi:TonB family protein
MFDVDSLVPKTEEQFPSSPRSRRYQNPKRRSMMVVALALLLVVSLGFVLYRHRDSWLPDIHPADGQSELTAAASSTTTLPVEKKRHDSKLQPKHSVSVEAPPPGIDITERTVLPPLEVEVIAGRVHRIVHPSSRGIYRFNLQSKSHPQPASELSTVATDTAASVTSNAAEHEQMSSATAETVGPTAKPDYPLLARQMKLQGSVILQALISRDGDIQALEVVSGPDILAGAAKEAVKQWHFKPHYKGADAVETKTKITVNFLISTN